MVQLNVLGLLEIVSYMLVQKLIAHYQNFFEILFFKKKPQDIKISHNEFSSLLIIYFVISFITAYIYLSSEYAIPFAFIDIFLLMSFVFFCLLICGFTNRWRQSTAAIAGCGSLFGIIGIPLLFLINQFKDSPEITTIISFFLTMLVLWNIVINGHIFRHAFSIFFIGGLGIALMYYLLMNALVVLLIPEALNT